MTAWLVWGAGAIGGTIGGFLRRAGHDVTFVDVAAEHVAAIRTAGLRIEGPVATFAVKAPAYLPDELQGTFDAVLLCVKGQHTSTAARALQPFLAAEGFVASLQNGLNDRHITEVIGAQRTIAAFVNFGADYVEPGRILYGGRGALAVGELDGRITERLTRLHAALRDFDETVKRTQNIRGYLWGKLAYSSLLFATALSHLPMGEALARPDWAPLWHGLAGEAIAVAAAEKVRPEGFNGFKPAAYLPGGSASDRQASLDGMIAYRQTTTKNHSGMWRDMAVRRRKTEVDEQPGLIVRIGAMHGLDCPLLHRLVDMIHAVEAGTRGFDESNIAELARLAVATR